MIRRAFFAALAVGLLWFAYKLLKRYRSHITEEEISEFSDQLASQSADDIFGELDF